MIIIPTQEKAMEILRSLYAEKLDSLLEEYRQNVNRPFFPHSWLQATAYLAVGGKQLMKPGVFALRSTSVEREGTSQLPLPL